MPDLTGIAQAQQVDVRSLQERARSSASRRKNITIVDKRNDRLDKSSFLKLLVKQLEHQDPLQPMSDRDFIAQMAQFSSLEQMQNVATSMDSMKSFQANFLVGKLVTGRDFVTGKPIEGVVDQVLFDADRQVFLRVNGRRIKFNDLASVGLNPEKPAQIPNYPIDQSNKSTTVKNIK